MQQERHLEKSSALFDFDRGQFLPVKAYWRMMGWSSETDISCLSQSEAMQISGNGMAVTTTCRILFPLLKHLGYFLVSCSYGVCSAAAREKSSMTNDQCRLVQFGVYHSKNFAGRTHAELWV